MKIAISGANGYIAKNLIRELQVFHFEIIPLSRDVLYDLPLLTEKITGAKAVVLLGGAPILKRWTTTNKVEIIQSRTRSTQNIVQAINSLPDEVRPATFISASAVGIYLSGLAHNEDSTYLADDFLGEVVKSWEKSSDELNKSVRKIIFRIGVVIGKESQTIKKMLPIFKMGLGGKIGTGKQPFPFVHIEDVVGAISWAIQNREVHGIYNLVAPEIMTNEKLTCELSKRLNRPAVFRVPEFALKLVYGKASSLLLQSPVVYPERLIKHGFRFRYPDLKSGLAEIIA